MSGEVSRVTGGAVAAGAPAASSSSSSSKSGLAAVQMRQPSDGTTADFDTSALGRRRSSLRHDLGGGASGISMRGAGGHAASMRRRSSVEGGDAAAVAGLATSREHRRASLGLGPGGVGFDGSHHSAISPANSVSNSRARSAIYEHLSANIEAIQREPARLLEFEGVVAAAVADAADDVALIEVLVGAGWAGGRFPSSAPVAPDGSGDGDVDGDGTEGRAGTGFDANALFMALSNLYLRTNTLYLAFRRSSTYGAGPDAVGAALGAGTPGAGDGGKGEGLGLQRGSFPFGSLGTADAATADGRGEEDEDDDDEDDDEAATLQILSFCPSLLVKHLASRLGEEVRAAHAAPCIRPPSHTCFGLVLA